MIKGCRRICPELIDSAFEVLRLRRDGYDDGTRLQRKLCRSRIRYLLYAAAGNPAPKPASYTGPRSFRVLQVLNRIREHCEKFVYKRINTDVPVWVIARASGKDFIEHLSEKIWQPLGMEQEADMMVDKSRTPLQAAGSICRFEMPLALDS